MAIRLSVLSPVTRKRLGSVIGVRAERLAEYLALHANVPPGVCHVLSQANFRNYSLFYHRMPDGKFYLFRAVDYVGADYAADMAALDKSPDFQTWKQICRPMQEPLENRAANEWWAEMPEIFISLEAGGRIHSKRTRVP